jgi:hypothetical protein
MLGQTKDNNSGVKISMFVSGALDPGSNQRQ